jgi:hypothetical protein
MSNKLLNINKFVNNYDKNELFKKLIYSETKVNEFTTKWLLYHSKFMNFEFKNYLQSELAYEFYSIYYESISNPKKLIFWITDIIATKGINQFVHTSLMIINNTDNHHRFRTMIDSDQPFELIESGLNFEFKTLATKYNLDKLELLYLTLLSDHEYFSIHDYKLESLAQFYDFLKQEYQFEIEHLMLLLSIIQINDNLINEVTEYINNQKKCNS